MDKGIYTAVGSINAKRNIEANAGHELANGSTIGFKKADQMALQTYRVDGQVECCTRQDRYDIDG